MNTRRATTTNSGAKNALRDIRRDTYENERYQMRKWAASVPEKTGILQAKKETQKFILDMREKANSLLGKEKGELAVRGYDLLLENYLGIIAYQAVKKCGYIIEIAFGNEPILNEKSRPLTRKAIAINVANAEESISKMAKTYMEELLVSREKLREASTAEDFSRLFTPVQAKRIMDGVRSVF